MASGISQTPKATFSFLPLPSRATAVPLGCDNLIMDFCFLFRVALRGVAVLAILRAPVGAAELNGKQIYAQHCAKCHGANGEGSDEEYPERLIGELSVGELARLIDKTMPYQHPE